MLAFLKDLFPSVEKQPQIDPKPPNLLARSLGEAVSIIGPLFNIEAYIQALLTNPGGYDDKQLQQEILNTVKSAPCVIYTYALSPFSTEAVSVIESTSCKYKTVELGLEWFTLGPKGSATRFELGKMYGQVLLATCLLSAFHTSHICQERQLTDRTNILTLTE